MLNNRSMQPVVNFINILRTCFFVWTLFFYVHVTRKKLPKRHLYEKFACLTLMKLTPTKNENADATHLSFFFCQTTSFDRVSQPLCILWTFSTLKTIFRRKHNYKKWLNYNISLKMLEEFPAWVIKVERGRNTFWTFKLSCDSRFQHAFTACCCVFKVITLFLANQRNFFENATTFSKRMRKTLVATQLKAHKKWEVALRTNPNLKSIWSTFYRRLLRR